MGGAIMRTIISLTIVLVLMSGLLASCSEGTPEEKTSGELATAYAQIQSLANERDAARSQLKDKVIESSTVQAQLKDAQTKIQSYQNVFPLREFKSLSELQGFLKFTAKGWQLDMLKMQLEDKRSTSIDFARALQAAAAQYGFIISIQIDKATGQVFNTAIIDNTVYAINPIFTLEPGGMASNKVWIYQ